jgi:hypothetical protein
MSKRYERHVESVLHAFLDLLEPEVRASLSQEHLDELQMLMESAVSTAVLEQLEVVADEVSNLGALIRRRAEKFDATQDDAA